LDSSLKKQSFQAIDIHTGKVIAQNEVITGQQTGGFETDGILLSDTVNHRIFFMEYYRNRFYCMDSSLQVLYIGHTIDTVTTNSITIKLTNIEGDDRLMPATPRPKVNKDCYISNEYLLAISALKADNEDADSFREKAVVDLYKLSDGKYAGSFYIPQVEGEKIKSLVVKNNLVVVLYKSRIASFHINI
jgi:hypothetical protein